MVMQLWRGPTRSKNVTDELQPARSESVLFTYQAVHNGPIASELWPFSVPGSYRTFSSLYAPNFHKLVSEGWVFQFPYSIVKDEWTTAPAYIRDDYYQGSPVQHTWAIYDNIIGYFSGYPPFPSISGFDATRHQRAQDEVLTRVYAKANSGKTDLLIDLSQYKQTVQLFVSSLRRLLSLASTVGAFYRYVSRGPDYRRRVRIPNVDHFIDPKNLAGLWCEMRFGWRPLLSTLNGVIEALNSLHGGSKRVTYRAFEPFSYQEEKLSVLHQADLGFQSTINASTKYSYESSFRSGILLEKETTLAQDLGLDLRYVPIAVWDLIPFSFIVDRFVNVGNFIRAVHPIPISAFGGSWVVERFEHSHLFRGEYLSHSFSSGSGSSYKGWTRSGSQDWAKHAVSGVVRQVFDRPPPLPTLRHDWLEFKDLYNLIDVLFLAIQRVKPH